MLIVLKAHRYGIQIVDTTCFTGHLVCIQTVSHLRSASSFISSHSSQQFKKKLGKVILTASYKPGKVVIEMILLCVKIPQKSITVTHV